MDRNELANEADAVADLPRVTRPALTFIALQAAAVAAAEAGLACCAANRHECANETVRDRANMLGPVHDHDESPGAWARRGARDGIIAAWEGQAYDAPAIGVSDLELYCAAWSLACLVVNRVRSEVCRG
jgi:hypothetical protein